MITAQETKKGAAAGDATAAAGQIAVLSAAYNSCKGHPRCPQKESSSIHISAAYKSSCRRLHK
jgi:hypothetical protein